MLGDHVHHVVYFALYSHVRDIQRLRVYFAVDRERKDLAELCRVYVAWRQDGFIQILSRAHIVVMVGVGAPIVRNIGERDCGLRSIDVARGLDGVPASRFGRCVQSRRINGANSGIASKNAVDGPTHIVAGHPADGSGKLDHLVWSPRSGARSDSDRTDGNFTYSG